MPGLPNRPFRFGVLCYPSSETLLSLPRRAEELGYSAYLLSDHLMNIAPIAQMAAAALTTTQIRIGTAVLGNDFWNPAVLAREILALDCISKGRLELGIGSGWYSQDYKWSGIPLDTPGVRISRLEESVQIFKGLLRGQEFSFQGKYYHIDGLTLQPKPIQQPHPPIVVGGGSPRVLRMAGRLADIVSINVRSTPNGWLDPQSNALEAFAQKVEWVREGAGERLPELELSVYIPAFVITDTPEKAAEQASDAERKFLGDSLTPQQLLQSPARLIGSVEQICEKLYQNRERFGLSYYVVSDLEAFAPVVARLAGK